LEPPSNPQLLAAMRGATESGKPEDRQGIYEAFRDSVVIVPIRHGPRGEHEVRAVRGNDGRPVVLAFTDPGAVAAWASGPVEWASMRGPDLASFAVDHGARAVVLNPNGPFAGELGFRELDALADSAALELKGVDAGSGAVRMEVRESSRIELRRPRAAPAGLVVALREALGRRANVERAYLLEAAQPGRPHLTLGVALAPGADPSEVVGEVGRVARSRLAPDEPLDVLPLDDALAASLAANVEPLW
jgi:hypothetical protein